MILDGFLNLINSSQIITAIGLVLRTWWWVFAPIIFAVPFKLLYAYWIQWEVFHAKEKWILLRIVPPKEIENTFKAMEDFYNVIWGIYDSANWREQWCEGESRRGPYWISFEIASIGGKIGFYIRCLDVHRSFIENTLYSHFPEIEISLTDDYAQKVPKDIPNAEWDLYSEDYTVLKPQPLPIKTYPMFFEEKPESAKIEETRIDPLDSLLESLANLHPDEQLWFQIVMAPITSPDTPIRGGLGWEEEGRAYADKLAQRDPKEKHVSKSIFHEVIETLLFGEKEEPKKEKPVDFLSAPELRMTAGEREILKGVEGKISKQGFKTWIRLVYLYKRNKPYFMGNYKIIRSYFNHFATGNLNALVFWGPTRTRIHYWMTGRRLYLRKRKSFRNYVDRLPSLYPRTMDGEPMFAKGIVGRSPGLRGTTIFNSEELASMYHFPAKISAVLAPALTPIEAKKAGPPVGLPTEEKKK